MTNDKYDVRWSPFDPKWYEKAFDKYINSADMLFNQNAIIEEGYEIPDADGSRSSVFRNEAVLNNSFNERLLRETLKDIYLNNSHRLVASNHDNVHFFQWSGTMSDMEIIPNTNYCQFSIPIDGFIYPGERDKFKMSQYFRKWIKVEDVLNHWDIFKWCCMLFIDQRIYSEYEIRIDDHEMIIKFLYTDFWIKQNVPVYIYKFDTNASERIKISRELCDRQWNWKLPLETINEKRLLNASHVIVAINKIGDSSIREDGETHVEILGDNLEFLEIKDGFIDLHNISDFNRAYILSEKTEWLWMSIISPKFFHEYPIVLPTDVIYQPYEANFQKVSSLEYDNVQHVKSKINYDSNFSQVYIDINGEFKENHNSWKQMIRPIVLTDAFDSHYVEPYDRIIDVVNELRDLTVEGANTIEEFRFYVKNFKTGDDILPYCSKLRKNMDDIRNCMHTFFGKLYIDYDEEYELLYKRFLTIMTEIDEVGIEHELFHTVAEYERPDRDFWMVISPLIWIPRGIADKYYVVNIIHTMGSKTSVWEDMKSNLDKVRFQRPVEESDFWTFEYDADKQVWRPFPLTITRHFPDVYTLKDSKEDTPSLNRVFKAFLFYSDTMNVLQESKDITKPTPAWDDNITEYHIEPSAVYRDIFMEKFYWMGIRSIYKGILATESRWEVVEYVIDNKSYDRFNQLFLHTMDPYFKLGLATYLRSPNFEFPFDDAIAKMQEAISMNFIDYKKITNFEMYLEKTWVPSYFDYVVKIMDDWKYDDRVIRRPKSTFDINRFLPIMLSAQTEVYDSTRRLKNLIKWIVERMTEETYKMNVDQIYHLGELIDEIYHHISEAYNSTKSLDLQIYSIQDINYIRNHLIKFLEYHNLIEDQFQIIYKDLEAHNVHEVKRFILDGVNRHVETIQFHIDEISKIVNDFDMNAFMSVMNELRTYFDHNKENPDDHSLLGHINQFNDYWTNWVKDKRTKLFLSSTTLFGFYDPNKLYENDEVTRFMNYVNTVKSDLTNLRNAIDQFYDGFGYKKDEVLYNKFDQTEYLLATLNVKLDKFMTARNELVSEYEKVSELFDTMKDMPNPTEFGYIDEIKKHFMDVIRHLSYIAGSNSKEHAEESKTEVEKWMQIWYRYLDTEKEVFDQLTILANPPIELLTILSRHKAIINSISDYMDTVNVKYIPDTDIPTYSDLYRVTKAEIITAGFENKVGDYVFVPGLGTYVISKVSGNNYQVESIEDVYYRNTTFKNPMTHYRPYDTITDGVGMGITIKPTEIEHRSIINDSAIDPILIRIESFIQTVLHNIQTYNPYWNSDLTYSIHDMNKIKKDWDVLVEKFWNYMSPITKVYVNDLIESLITFGNACERFISTRKNITLLELINDYDSYKKESFRYVRDHELQNDSYYYYYQILEVGYNQITEFCGSGSSWSNGVELKDNLIAVKRAITVYWDKFFSSLPEDDTTKHIHELEQSMNQMIDVMIKAIDDIPYQVIDLEDTLRKLSDVVGNTPSRIVDQWYRFVSSVVAIDGMQYKVGDIVEIVPTEEDIANMEELTTSDINSLWYPKIPPADYDKDAYNETGVRQINDQETNSLWHGKEVDENNPGNQRIKLTSIKPLEVLTLWQGGFVSSDALPVMEDENDETILLQITEVDDMGRVIAVKPFMDYALPYKLWGIRKTKTRVGDGYGLQIDCICHQITIEDSTLLNDDKSAIPKPSRFDENDLMKFTFGNIHDLPIGYEVFLGGKQITNFVLRHLDTEDPLHPEKIDVVYINANDVVNLQDSSIYIPAEHYFIYKIDEIAVADKGAGYCIGQDVMVDANGHTIKMKVTEMVGNPTKGIARLSISDGSILFEKVDPKKTNAEVVTDSMNNIDDEYNVGYYDRLTKSGIDKPLSKGSDLTYKAKRFDDMNRDNRNETFMYPSLPMKPDYPQNGDPDNHWYQGSRIENSQIEQDIAEMVPLTIRELENLWKFNEEPSVYDHDADNQRGVRNINEPETGILWNHGYVNEDNPGEQRIGLRALTIDEVMDLWNGVPVIEDDIPIEDVLYSPGDRNVWNGIANVVPPTDPFIPDSQRTPRDQPVKGEYQMIQSLRIHNSEEPGEYVDMIPLTLEELMDLWNENDIDDYDKDAYNETGVRQINDQETNSLWLGEIIDDTNPGNQRLRLKVISPLEVFMMWKGTHVPEEDDDSMLELDGVVIEDLTSVFNFRVESLNNTAMIAGDMTVEHFSDLPLHKTDFPEGAVGKTVIVENDETNYGHRMLYRIRTFVAAGFFVYDLPEIADYRWNEFNVNWMDSDWIADFPTTIAQYPEAPWNTAKSYRYAMHKILDGKVPNTWVPDIYNNTSFIANLTVDDISVYNWSTHEWEDLHDQTRWQLTTRYDDENKDWGFTLRFIQDGNYSYDMRLYLNKTPYTQQKNAELKRNATVDISTVIHSEVNTPALNLSVNTGRHLRIRKLFPYEQKESYRVGVESDGEALGYSMDFRLAPYMHYKNQLHLEDIKIYNKTAGRFENVLDQSMFEVQFKDPRVVSRGMETHTKMSNAVIGNAGIGFIDGPAWAWNSEYQISVFGRVTADWYTDGHMLEFLPTHCPNPPKENISLEFEVYQNDNQSNTHKAIVVIDFVTEKVEMFDDGYIHHVTEPMAPLPNEFRVIVMYKFDGIGEYEIILNNNPMTWNFIEPNWMTNPTFHIDGYQLTSDHLYALTDKGRLPLINPSTRKPMLKVDAVNDGTNITYINLYRRYQKLTICSVPYPMKSVYVQRRIPKSGFIDLNGKLNKPLNKRYFEFWVNGKLLHDEVTIISPSKLFLHGLTSLKNFEIIEINRNSNEYFSDIFLETDDSESRPKYGWNYNTYLDDALSGNLENDNYTIEEQENLLTPVWPQVEDDHPEFKNYPCNVDTDPDILVAMNVGDSIDNDIRNPLYPYMIIDPPTLEGKPIIDKGLSLEHFGLLPISNEMIVDMLNEEWAEEIKTNPYLREHYVMSDDEWYGTTARLYDEYGILVHTLNESVYNVHDDNILNINTNTKKNRITKRTVSYDLD